MKKIFFRIVCLLLFAFLLTGCSKNIPFAEKNAVTFSDLDGTYEAPVFFYTSVDGQYQKLDDVQVVPHNMTYHFHDYEMSKVDKDGNVLITFICDLTTVKEYYSSHYGRWGYNDYYLIPSFMDYYTGDVYRMKYVSSNASTELFGTNNEEATEMKYTTIEWKKKKYSVGIYMDVLVTQGDRIEYGVENGVRHDETPVTITMNVQIKVPENYDGVVLFLNKKGQNEETYLKSKEKNDKLLALQEQAKETGKKSKELKDLEKDMNKVSKLDLKKKGKNKYYFLRISDAFPSKKVKQFPIAFVIICLVVVVVGVVCFIFIKRKKKKDNFKKEEK